MKIRTLVVILVIAALAVACGPTGGSQDDSVQLDGTNWSLVELNGQALVDGTSITAEFSGEEITGNSGCNSYFGSYTLGGSSIEFGMMGMTEMACLDPEGVMDQEMTYLDTLQSAAEVVVTDNQLEMLDTAGDVILAFER